MNFSLPSDLVQYSGTSTLLSSARSFLCKIKTTTIASLTTVASMHVPTGIIVVYRTQNGRRCSSNADGAPTKRASMTYRTSMALLVISPTVVMVRHFWYRGPEERIDQGTVAREGADHFWFDGTESCMTGS